MEAQDRGGFQDDCDTDHSARAHEQRTDASDHAVPETEAWRTLSRTIEDQQPLLDEYGFGHDDTHAAGAGQSNDRRQDV